MERRLYRSRTERLVSGVCGGLGKYFDVDPVLVRVAFLLITVATGVVPGIVAYIIMAIVVPKEGTAAATPREATQENIEEIKKTATEFREDMRATFGRQAATPQTSAPTPIEESTRRNASRNLIGIILILVGVIFLFNTLGFFWWFQWNYLWPVVLIAIGLLVIIFARRT